MTCDMVTAPPVILLDYLEPGYCKVKRKNESQAKAQECFYLDPAPNYPRNSVRVLTKTLYCANRAQCKLATRVACTIPTYPEK